MVGKPRQNGNRTYFCAKGVRGEGCNKTTSVADLFEALIADAVLYRLDTPELQRKLIGAAAQDDQAADLQAEVDRTQVELDELASAYGERAISLREWLIARAPIEERQSEATKRMGQLIGSSALDNYVGNARHLRAQWSNLAPDRQRSIIGALINRVTVNPAVKGRTAFDATRFDISWRV
jgi:hypothetical protein